MDFRNQKVSGNLYKRLWLVLLPVLFSVKVFAGEVLSPNKKNRVTISVSTDADGFGQANMKIEHNEGKEKVTVFPKISVGFLTDKRNFSKDVKISSVSKVQYHRDEYQMVSGKRKNCLNESHELTVTFINRAGQTFDLTVRAYNDGVAFQYQLDAQENEHLLDESTAYFIADGTPKWMMPYKNDYEGFFDKRIANTQNIWGYPSLIQSHKNVYSLISEANISRGNCGSQLDNRANADFYKVRLGDSAIALNDQWKSPWRTVIIGSVAEIVESTLVTDVSDPVKYKDISWIKPGNVSWIYWAYNHSSSDFVKVKEYIDLAARMGWGYSLIDWKWDKMTNGGNVEEAIRYSLQKGVKPLLWYNSGTSWIGEGAPGPLDRLNTKENREKEYRRLQELGVAGIKIDFFNGDGVQMMNYYQDLLQDAEKYRLMVNFHGSTLPRGWERTYPNLMTMEAVYGAEWYNNNALLTGKAAVHNVTLPFTRNVVGSMDYTPGTFSDSQHKHTTSHGHELALMVAFESAWQHRPDRPETYAQLPARVKSLLSELPTTWDDTKLLSGEPGQDIVIARRKGEKWYVAGLNGLGTARELTFDPSKLVSGKVDISLIADGQERDSFRIDELTSYPKGGLKVKCLGEGGFVAVISGKNK